MLKRATSFFIADMDESNNNCSICGKVINQDDLIVIAAENWHRVCWKLQSKHLTTNIQVIEPKEKNFWTEKLKN